MIETHDWRVLDAVAGLEVQRTATGWQTRNTAGVVVDISDAEFETLREIGDDPPVVARLAVASVAKASRNPNPALITATFWQLWLDAQRIIPGVRLGGIYANKSGYHNTVAANLRYWPGTYSVRLRLDLDGDRTKSRAIDLTMSTSEMRKRCGYLQASISDPDDDRLDLWREFYGTLDGRTVWGRIKDSKTGKWRTTTSDSSHLWHLHAGCFASYVSDEALAGLISVLSGEPYSDWSEEMRYPRLGDSGEVVKRWQLMLTEAGHPVTPDGDYGSKTAAAVAAFYRTVPDAGAWDGHSITGRIAYFLERKAFAGQPGPRGPKGEPGDPATFPAEVAFHGTITDATVPARE